MNDGSIVIRIIGLADGMPTAFDGKYLVEYDPTRDGIDPEGYAINAHIAVTSDPQEAQRFESVTAAVEASQAASGWRLDGQPNRPLTAFTIEFLETNL